MDELSDQQFERYARHLILDEIGEAGQARLLGARVAVVGAGGLGAPALLYLAAAGVGRLTVIDDDVVDLSNLQRQVIHTTPRLDKPKAESARAMLADINPEVAVDALNDRLTAANAAEILAGHDLALDGSDNFATRYLVNDACYLAGVTLISGALLRFEAQITACKAHLGPPHPCYRCLFPEAPPPGLTPRCEEAGILGAVAGVAGTVMAVEAVKELIGLGDSLSGRLLVYDALRPSFHVMTARRDPACALCGPRATIRDLSGHAAH